MVSAGDIACHKAIIFLRVKCLTAFQALAATAEGFRKIIESAFPAPIRNLNNLLPICHVNFNFREYA